MAELQRSASKPALIKNGSGTGIQRKQSGHRVAFEVPSARPSGLSDIDSDIDHLQKGRHRPYCFAICVWTCIAVFILIILLLIWGISYLAFLQAGMPQVSVRMLNITKLQVDNSQRMDAVLALRVRYSNKNEKMRLLYGPLTADVISDGVQLGMAKVNGFSQKPQNQTYLDFKMNGNHAKVNPDAVNEIISDMNVHEMVFDVYVSGTIGFEMGTFQMKTVPFLTSCRGVKQMDVDFGRGPPCDIRMFAFRPSSN